MSHTDSGDKYSQGANQPNDKNPQSLLAIVSVVNVAQYKKGGSPTKNSKCKLTKGY
jgi:hypothetical protein